MGKATGSQAFLQSIGVENIDTDWPLVERQNIIDTFEREIIRPNGPIEEGYRCFLLCGDGGMGKSFCCDWYLKHTRSDFTQFMYYDFDMHKEDVTIADILLSWANLIVTNNSKYHFHSFIFTYNQYETVLGKAEKTLQRKMTQDNAVVQGILEAISMGNGPISSSFKIAEIFSKIFKKLLESNNDFYRRVSACEDLSVLEQLLVYAFCNDMEDNLKNEENYPFVFFIDTYEAYASSKREYIKKDSWIESLISALPNSIWVIAGREEPAWGSVKFDQCFRLGPITKEEAFKAIFEHAKINDIRLQGIIQKKSAGNPYYIQRLVKECLNSDVDIDENKLEATPVAERILRYVDGETAALAYALSYLESWGDDYLKEYTSFLGLNEIQISTQISDLKRTGIIHNNSMDKHVYICLQEAIEIDLLQKIYGFFREKINKNAADYYSRNRYLKALLSLYKNNPEAYREEVGKNLVRWFDMVCKKLLDALEKEFLPFWDNYFKNNEEDGLYVQCLIVYREFLLTAENKEDILETIQSCNEDKIFDFIRQNTRFLSVVLLQYNYVGAWGYADSIVNYVNDTIDLKELDETIRFHWLRSLINYYGGKEEKWGKAYQLYEKINEIVVNESNASEYLHVVYEMIAIFWLANDRNHHIALTEKAYRLGEKYLKEGSDLRHRINNEYLKYHNLQKSGEDTSELARDEYSYSIALYLPSMVEGVVQAKTILFGQLFCNEKFDDMYKIADEVEALYRKYPSRCKEYFLEMRQHIPIALFLQKKYQDAIEHADVNLHYAMELPYEPIRQSLFLASGDAYYLVAMAGEKTSECLKKADDSYKEAIKVCKVAYKDHAIQLPMMLSGMYDKLADVKKERLPQKPNVYYRMKEKAKEQEIEAYNNFSLGKDGMINWLSICKPSRN